MTLNKGIIGIANMFTPGSNVYSITGSTIDFDCASAQNGPARYKGDKIRGSFAFRQLAGLVERSRHTLEQAVKV